MEPGSPNLDPGADTIYLSRRSIPKATWSASSKASTTRLRHRLVAPGTGFALHDRGALFTLEPNHPNTLAGRKRPFHTLIPAFMENGDTNIGFGIMGGWNQSQAHAQFVSNIVDHKMNIQKALEAPRFTKGTFEGCDVRIEGRVPSATTENLKSRGHDLKVMDPYIDDTGCGQAVLRNFTTKVNYGASDPRKDSAAIPEPIRAKR